MATKTPIGFSTNYHGDIMGIEHAQTYRPRVGNFRMHKTLPRT